MTKQTPFNFNQNNYKRVKDYLPPPTECRYCLGEVTIKHHKDYYGKEYGNYPWLYSCDGCKASVRIHPNTDIPLGVLADKRLKDQRKVIKNRFIQIGEDFNLHRGKMYDLLSSEMDIPKRNCHFGWFIEEDLTVAGEALNRVVKKLSRGR